MKSYGLCRTTIYPWLRAHEKRGEMALQSRPSTGRPPTLSDRQQRQVRRWICGKDARQYGFDFGLWTRSIVAELVEKKFDHKLSLTAVGRLLAALEITPQKPLRRAYVSTLIKTDPAILNVMDPTSAQGGVPVELPISVGLGMQPAPTISDETRG
jgi:transposase